MIGIGLGPQPGDLLVSPATATMDYLVTIVPTADCLLRGIENSAVTGGLHLAQHLGVDLWLTEDHIHFLQLAAFQSPRRRLADKHLN